jgi:DNA-binding LacI/PurR family transcriptional regulator
MARPRSATSTDVAHLAGVSQATVSVVLNGARSTIRVSAETRQRVLAAAAELGYIPHPAAQALRRQRSGIIGFLPRIDRDAPFTHPIHYLLTIHASRAAHERGYQFVEAGPETDPWRDSAEDELVQYFLNRRADGVIFDGPKTATAVQRLLDHGLPVVQIFRPQLAVLTPTVTVDARPGITAAVDHLIALGHRRIAFIGRGGNHPVDLARLAAFLAALANHGLPTTAATVRLSPIYELDHGERLTRELLARRPRPTAIFAGSDSLALGALRALYAARVHVPDELSLIGYDDTLAAQLYPPLTSVAQPFAALAERAIALLIGQLEQPDDLPLPPEQVVLPTQLNLRESTAPPDSRGH